MDAAHRLMGEHGGTGERGEATAVATMVREHGPSLARVCMALLGDAARAESVLELVVREAARAPAAGDRAWLYGLARVACATELSKLPLRSSKPTASGQDVTVGSAARARLAELRPTEREAVVLYAIGGLKAEEVAVAVGVSVDVARARIASGMIELARGRAR
jgi:DNA-directed RNA polymerase specialized sigma24 family protein